MIMAETLKLCTFNVNGLRQKDKRLSIFKRLYNLKSIILLQETHSTENVEQMWRDDWKGDIEFCHGTSSSCGVAILTPQGLDIHVQKIDEDTNGRMLIVKIVLNTIEYIIVNIYAPVRKQETQQIEFIHEVKEKITPFINETLLMGGDYNFYMSRDLDKLDAMSNTHDNELYRQEILQILDTHGMVDVFRVLNPQTRRYTWHSRGLASRLDYWFISEELLNITKNVEIKPGIFSDHSMVVLEIGTNNDEYGRGFWKFNCMLLHDTNYVNYVKDLIKRCNNKLDYLEDKCLKWEIIKSEIRSYTVPYCVKKKKEKNLYKAYLENRLEDLLPELSKDNDILKEEYFSTKIELEQLEKTEIMGVMIRSKAKYIEEGEKNSKFFLGLEKRNSVNKSITQLKVGSALITKKDEILSAEHEYYQKLYSETLDDTSDSYKSSFEYFTKDVNFCKITEQDRELLDHEITQKEILKSVKSLKKCKSPGSDGFTSEFYQFFWIDIKNILMDSINFAFQNGQLSVEQRRGILTLIPKKDKDRIYLKNWRPITLLNTDYKIIARILGTRLQTVLPYIIDEDQTGYISGRYIGQNIRIIEDILYFVEKEKLPGIIMTIDFEKAFDSINWNFIIKALELFNIGPYFCKWVKIMYTNICSTVINNGFICKWFYPTRGIRQGCPLSAYLFIIAAEILACKIRQDKNIGGINVGKKIIKISQLADDTTCVLDGLRSLENILETFRIFTQCAGLKINIDKTKTKYIGTLKNCDYYPHGLSWIKDNITTLGVTFTNTETESYMFNFKPKLIKLENTLQIWKQRTLSLKGKVTIINSLALSPLVYVAGVISTPQRVIIEVDKILLNFFWNSNRSKIAKNVIVQQIKNGGLKFPDFESKVKALRLSWIKRFMTGPAANWKLIPMYYYNCNDMYTFFGSKHYLLTDKCVIPEFYKSCYNLWCDIHAVQPTTGDMVINEVIWNNRYITISNKPYCIDKWQKAGISTISDILDGECNFLSHTELCNKYNISCNFLEILQIRQSIPIHWRNMLSNVDLKKTTKKAVQINDKLVPVDRLSCKFYYWLLIYKKLRKPQCTIKWAEHFPLFKNVENSIWERIYEMPYKVTRETKLQSFQFRIIHRIIPCNKWLYNISIKSTSKCNFCNEEDDLLHYFLYCPVTKQFWKYFSNWWNRQTDICIGETLEEHMLFGYPGNSDIEIVLNYCILLGKWYIFCQKIHEKNTIDIYDYLVQLKQRLFIEKTICIRDGNLKSFDKWNFLYEQL